MAETYPVSESYEGVRDSVPDADVRAAWRDGDRFREHYREQVRRIQEDTELTQEGKDRKLAELHERIAGRIASSYKGARDKARSISSSSYGQSVPLPDGKTLAMSKVQDSAELLALSGEVEAVRAFVDKLADTLPEALKKKSSTPDRLGLVYAEAMETGGIEGKVRARAVLKVAEEKGVPVHDVVEPFMDDKHRNALEQHRRYDLIATTIPPESYVPKAPAATTPKTPGRIGTYGAGDKVVIPQRRGQLFKRQRPSWK